jgi:hypothetical protein
MPDYRVLFYVPGSPGTETLFETVVSGVDTPREAGAIGAARWQVTTPELRADVWLEVLEFPEEVLVLRMPVAGPQEPLETGESHATVPGTCTGGDHSRH